MDPKNGDRIGKGILTAAGVAIVVAAKKYGPKIIEKTLKIFSKK